MRALLCTLIPAMLLVGLLAPEGDAAPARKRPAVKRSAAKSKARKKVVAKRRPVSRRKSVSAKRAPAKPIPPVAVPAVSTPIVATSLRETAPGLSVPRLDCTRQALHLASSFQGLRYRSGGSTPQTGFDCSGLVKYVYANACEIDLPRTVQAQMNLGAEVGRNELQPGDLVFFRRGTAGWHVGIYSGEGQFIHSPNRRDRVRYSALATPYFQRNYIGARRMANDLQPVLPEPSFPPPDAVAAGLGEDR